MTSGCLFMWSILNKERTWNILLMINWGVLQLQVYVNILCYIATVLLWTMKIRTTPWSACKTFNNDWFKTPTVSSITIHHSSRLTLRPAIIKFHVLTIQWLWAIINVIDGILTFVAVTLIIAIRHLQHISKDKIISSTVQHKALAVF